MRCTFTVTVCDCNEDMETKRHIIYSSFTCNVIRRFNRCCYLYRIRCRASDVNECEYMDGRAFYPLLVASQTIPITALAPLFVLWFGYTIWSKVVVTVLITFFPIAVNTYDGLRSTKKNGRSS